VEADVGAGDAASLECGIVHGRGSGVGDGITEDGEAGGGGERCGEVLPVAKMLEGEDVGGGGAHRVGEQRVWTVCERRARVRSRPRTSSMG
jgi:hypothetical protein